MKWPTDVCVATPPKPWFGGGTGVRIAVLIALGTCGVAFFFSDRIALAATVEFAEEVVAGEGAFRGEGEGGAAEAGADGRGVGGGFRWRGSFAQGGFDERACVLAGLHGIGGLVVHRGGRGLVQIKSRMAAPAYAKAEGRERGVAE